MDCVRELDDKAYRQHGSSHEADYNLVKLNSYIEDDVLNVNMDCNKDLSSYHLLHGISYSQTTPLAPS